MLRYGPIKQILQAAKFLVPIVPVSYTHLDVYKRQPYRLPKLRMVFAKVVLEVKGYIKKDVYKRQITMNSVFIQFLSYGGQLGVNLFVLISGYFLVKNEFKVKKAVKLWMDISIYAIIIMLIFAIAGTDFNFFEVVKNIFPIPYNMWWFATSYFMMYLLSGYINKLIYALSKRELDHLILLLIVICSILPTFMAARMTSTLMWFFLL